MSPRLTSIESYRLAETSSYRAMAEEAKAASRLLAVATGEAAATPGS